MPTPPDTAWYPVARSDDAPARHIFHGQLLSQELAVWRADDGFVNVWQNRCLHRGVRLTVGDNDGGELVCRYHGWRYANRSGGCTYIPAHPADAPAQTICNTVFPSVERFGLIWTTLGSDGEPPLVDTLEGASEFGLRPLPVNAPADVVLDHLGSYRFAPAGALTGDPAVRVAGIGDASIELVSTADGHESAAVFFVQPVDAARCVIRGVLAATPGEALAIPVLRHHNHRLSVLRDRIESSVVGHPPGASPAPAARADERSVVPADRAGLHHVRVGRRWDEADGIVGFALEPIEGQLPAFQPGAHIDVHLPNGLVRQYSLTNGPGQTRHYLLAVKREPQSSGGSSYLHESLAEGDELHVSAPRNNFPLRRDVTRTLLIAGGIGITPLVSMAHALSHAGLEHELHYFARGPEHLAFATEIDRLSTRLITHLGLSPEATGVALRTMVADPGPDTQIYVCGPGPLIQATRDAAAAAGWPDQAVHFEYFANPTVLDQSSSFEVSLARSALTVSVPAGRTILEVLRDHGIAVPASCQQGACGTCSTRVLEGEPAHQDVYLNDSEHRAGDAMMICVSRSHSDRLVLDI
ncbi:MAG: Rieske 2Fe-2S domain-containing protein [Acidimicrobiia bacterium]|nr:Rieske 2Fe-2S domain-containing protein [Acidimicrobiia bacterium]